MAKTKCRADQLVYQQGLASSREKAKRLIMAGLVVEGSRRIDKPGEQLDIETELRLKGQMKYVSRGGYKLEKILENEAIDLKDKVCIDIGASTGGFTDCMLQAGAKKVYAIDVGYNQLDFSLRQDPRVINMEKINIRYLELEDLKEKADFISIDVSFISLDLVLPVAKNLLKEDGLIAALIKPQFEAGKDKVGKGGIVRDKKIHLEVLEKMLALFTSLGLNPLQLTDSPIHGAKGNIEFLALLGLGHGKSWDLKALVDKAHQDGGKDVTGTQH